MTQNTPTLEMLYTPASLPAGYRWGVINTHDTSNMRYIIRESDDASALVPEGDARCIIAADDWLTKFETARGQL